MHMFDYVAIGVFDRAGAMGGLAVLSAAQAVMGVCCLGCHGSKPPNAKAANNDTANVNAIPSPTATARGKPSDFMAFSPQPGAKSRRRIAFLKAWDHAKCIDDYSRDLGLAKWGSGSGCTAAIVQGECQLCAISGHLHCGILFDQFVGASYQLGRNLASDCLRGLKVEHQFKPCRLLDGKVAGLGATQDLREQTR
jgi:hypothetical protein